MMLDLMQDESKCPICGGSTWSYVDPADNHKGVRRCSCYQRGIVNERIRKSGLSEKIRKCTFESFSAVEPWQKTMKNKAEIYKDALLKGSKPWLFMGGTTSCGKTHLCTAVCGELIKAGKDVRYMIWLSEELHTIKASVNDQSYSDILQQYISADVLYIDDLFKSKGSKNLNPTDADVRLCFELLNGRYNRDLPTIMSSEFFLDSELLNVDEATFSRVIEKTGKDFIISIGREPGRNYRLKGVKQI